jgi:hypothetical protein
LAVRDGSCNKSHLEKLALKKQSDVPPRGMILHIFPENASVAGRKAAAIDINVRTVRIIATKDSERS